MATFTSKNKARIVAVDTNNKNPQLRVSEIPRKMLVLGNANTDFLGQKDIPIKIEKEADIEYFGVSSPLTQMLKTIYSDDNYFELYGCAVSPNRSATPSTTDVVISGSPSTNGTITLYIAGIRIPVIITKGMTQEQMYDAMVRDITATLNVPVSAEKSEGNDKITLTSKWKGCTANDITITSNITNTELENMPKGVSLVVNNFTGGAGAVDLTNIMTNWSSIPFTSIATAFTDDADIDLLMQKADDLFDWRENRGFYVIGGFNSDETSYVNYVQQRNDKYYCAFWVENSPTPRYIIASAVAKAIENQFAQNVAVQLDGKIPNILQGQSPYRSYDQKNKIVNAGGCTVVFDEFGDVLFDNTNTTYKTAEDNTPDDAFFFLQTLGKLQVVQYETKQAFSKTPYFRAVLIDDDAIINSNINAVRPITAKATLSSLITSWEARALLNSASDSRDKIVAWIDENVPGLLNITTTLYFTSPLGKILINLDWTLQLNS